MISITSITKHYKNVTALDHVSLDIPSGSVFGFLGPNGAGKTTLIRILTGIIIPDSGEIKINDKPVSRLNVKRIGYLPEERGLYKKMKVGEQAIYLAVMKGLSKQEAEKRLKEWFEKLAIADWWNKTVENLSKGMQQKIQFVISAIHQPDLLILDEPLSGLDPVNREVLGNEIIELNKKGMTIVLSTHDMNSVEQFCSDVMLINKGKIVIHGGVNAIKQSRKTCTYEFCFQQRRESLTEACNRFNAQIIADGKNGNGFWMQVRFVNEQDARNLLVNVAEQTGLTSFRELLPSMHDIFVESITNKNQVL